MVRGENGRYRVTKISHAPIYTLYWLRIRVRQVINCFLNGVKIVGERHDLLLVCGEQAQRYPIGSGKMHKECLCHLPRVLPLRVFRFLIQHAAAHVQKQNNSSRSRVESHAFHCRRPVLHAETLRLQARQNLAFFCHASEGHTPNFISLLRQERSSDTKRRENRSTTQRDAKRRCDQSLHGKKAHRWSFTRQRISCFLLLCNSTAPTAICTLAHTPSRA